MKAKRSEPEPEPEPELELGAPSLSARTGAATMIPREWAECVGRTPVFKTVRKDRGGSEFCAAVVQRLERQVYLPKETIIVRGKTTNVLQFILSGCVQILYELDDEHPLAELRANDLLGEVELLDQRPCKAYAVAGGTTETVVLCITRENFEQCLSQHKQVEMAVKIGILERSKQRTQRAKSKNENTALWTHAMLPHGGHQNHLRSIVTQCIGANGLSITTLLARFFGPLLGFVPFVLPMAEDAVVFECLSQLCEEEGPSCVPSSSETDDLSILAAASSNHSQGTMVVWRTDDASSTGLDGANTTMSFYTPCAPISTGSMIYMLLTCESKF